MHKPHHSAYLHTPSGSPKAQKTTVLQVRFAHSARLFPSPQPLFLTLAEIFVGATLRGRPQPQNQK